MFGLLHEYLVENRTLYLRGTGQLQIVHQPARYDVVNKVLDPPQHIIKLSGSQQAGSLQPLMAFISRQLSIPEEHAFSLYESFSNQLQKDIDEKSQVAWEHLGLFCKDETGQIVFTQEPELQQYTEAVAAERIIRKNASHHMIVGALETTNTAMREMLSEPEPGPELIDERWWIAALVLGITSIIFIVLKKFALL